MKRTRDTVNNTRTLRSSNSKGNTAPSEPAETMTGGESSSKKTRSSKNSSQETNLPGTSSASAFKTPKARAVDNSASRSVPSSSSSKGLPPINLDVLMQEKWPERPVEPPVDFRANLLSPVSAKPISVPRHKRSPVQDPALCADVADNIFEMCYEQELRYSSNWDYMVCQPNLTWQMRAILVDWIVDVHHMMKLQGPTLWLTVNLVDRTLARITMPRTRLQLVGIAALSLACKIEEIALPYPDDFTYITEDAYSCEDLLAMELEILDVIHYEVHVPTAYHFLTRYLDLLHASDATRQLAFYYAERNLQETTSLALMPSAYAAVCLYAAMVQRDSHSEPVASDVPTEDLEEVALELYQQLKELRVMKAVAAGELPPEGSGQAPPWVYDFDIDDLDGTSAADSGNVPSSGDVDTATAVVKQERVEDVVVKTEECVESCPINANESVKAETVSTSDPMSDLLVGMYHDCNKALQDRAAAVSALSSSTSIPEWPRARPSGVSLWGIDVSLRAPGRPLSCEAYPLPPAKVAVVLSAGSSSIGSGSSCASASGASSSGAGGITTSASTSNSSTSALLASALSSQTSRVARLLAHLPPQPQKAPPPDVTVAALELGVSKLLQELPGCVDVPMLQFYAKLVIEHVGKEVVSSSKRHLNAARRKYSSVHRRHLQVANFGLPFFTAQEPTVHTELLGHILHRTTTAFYPGKITACAAVKLLNPSHFPIPASSNDLVEVGQETQGVGSASEGGGDGDGSGARDEEDKAEKSGVQCVKEEDRGVNASLSTGRVLRSASRGSH